MAIIKPTSNYITGNVGLNNTASLTAEVNMPTTNTTYIGSETDSLRITVDNESKIISGDVIWTDILGETPNRAYPGNKGAENRARIEELSELLLAEIKRSVQKDDQLTSKIEASLSDQSSLETLIKEEVQVETTRAIEAETALKNKEAYDISNLYKELENLLAKLIAEETLRKSEDKDLAKRISNISTQSASELSLIKDRLQKEIERASAADEQLNADLRDETLRASSKESSLEKRIDVTASNLDSRVNSLSKQIKNEINRSTQSDSNLNAAISSEINRARVAESNLETKLDSRLDNIQSVIDENNNELATHITELDAELNGLNSLVTDRFDELDTKDAEFNTRISNSEVKIASSIAEIESLTSKVDNNSEIININKININNLLSQYTELSDADISLKLGIDTLSASQETLENRVNNAESNIEDLKNDISSLKNEDINLESDISQLDSRLQTVENSVTTHTTQLESLQDSQNDTSLKVTDVETEVESLKTKSNSAEEDIRILETDVTSLKEDNTIFRTKFSSQDSKFKELTQNLTELDAEIESLDNKLSQTTSDLEETIATQDRKISSLENDEKNHYNNLRSNINSINSTINDLSTQVATKATQAQINLLNDKVQTVESNASIFNTSIVGLNDAIKAETNARLEQDSVLIDTVQVINVKIRTLGDFSSDNARDIASLENQVSKLDDAVKLKADTATMNETITRVITEIDTVPGLDGESTSVENAVVELNNEIKTLQSENAFMQMQIKDLSTISFIDGGTAESLLKSQGKVK